MKIQLSFYFSTVQTVSSAAAFLPQGYSIKHNSGVSPIFGEDQHFFEHEMFFSVSQSKEYSRHRVLRPASVRGVEVANPSVVAKARVWI